MRTPFGVHNSRERGGGALKPPAAATPRRRWGQAARRRPEVLGNIMRGACARSGRRKSKGGKATVHAATRRSRVCLGKAPRHCAPRARAPAPGKVGGARLYNTADGRATAGAVRGSLLRRSTQRQRARLRCVDIQRGLAGASRRARLEGSLSASEESHVVAAPPVGSYWQWQGGERASVRGRGSRQARIRGSQHL